MCPDFSVDLHRLWYSLSEKVNAGTISDSCLIILCVFCLVSLWVFSRSVLSTLVHRFWSLTYVSLFAFTVWLVFLHGCVQCVYTSSMWQHHLPLGGSICVCHHGLHHLQSQVPIKSSHCVSSSKTSTFVFKNLNVASLEGQLVNLMCCIVVFL